MSFRHALLPGLWLLLLGLGHSRGPASGADPVAESGHDLSSSLVVPRDRPSEQLFELAKLHLQQQNWGAAVSQLQQLLDREPDGFILDGGVYRSSWEAANDHLARLPIMALARYQRTVDAAARQSWEQARGSGVPKDLVRVATRFRFTPAGHRASLLLAAQHFDSGSPPAVVSRWLQRFEDQERVLGPVQGEPSVIQTGRALRQVVASVTRPAPPTSAAGRAPDWPCTGSLWQVPSDRDSAVRQLIAEGLAEVDAQSLVPMLSVRPVVAGDRVIAATHRGVLCLDLQTGQRVWEWRDADFDPAEERHAGGLRDVIRRSSSTAVLLQQAMRSSLWDRLSVTGAVVCRVIPEPPARLEDLTEETPPATPGNRLVALSLADGQLQWQLGAVDAEDGTEAARRFFLGPPAAWGNRLLGTAQRDHVIELLDMDSCTGEVVASLPLGQAIRPLREDIPRQGTACPVFVAGDEAYCTTAMGGLVCVDLIEWRIRWIFRYSRDDQPAASDSPVDSTHGQRVPTRDAWQDAVVAMGAEHLALASPESDVLYGLERRTGRPVWSHPRGRNVLLCGPVQERVFVLGAESATALELRSGETVWSRTVLRPAGNAILTNEHLIYPTQSGALVRMHLLDGRSEPQPVASGPAEFVWGDTLWSLRDERPGSFRTLGVASLALYDGKIIRQSIDGMSLMGHVERTESDATSSVHTEESAAARASRAAANFWQTVPEGLQRLAEKASEAGGLSLVRRACLPGIGSAGMLEAVRELADVVAHLTADLVSLEEQAAGRLRELSAVRSDPRGRRVEEVRALLQRLPAHKLYLSTEHPRHTVRLDRWRELRSPLDVEAVCPGEDPSIQRDRQDVGTASNGLSWPAVTPRLTERPSRFGNSYFVTVPMLVSGRSAWEQVTMEVDRPGTTVHFSRADLEQPVSVRLPRSGDTARMAPEFLHAWALGEFLCLRVGTELFGFGPLRHETGAIPSRLLWPRSVHLGGERAPLLIGLSEIGEGVAAPLAQSSPGFVDACGRAYAEVGPFGPEYLCYRERGHLIALDPRDGSELWRRSDLPPNRQFAGDDRAIVMLTDDLQPLARLCPWDGRSLGPGQVSSPSGLEPSVRSVAQAGGGRATLSAGTRLLCVSDVGAVRDRGDSRREGAHDERGTRVAEVVLSVINLAAAAPEESGARPVWTGRSADRSLFCNVDTDCFGVFQPPQTVELRRWDDGATTSRHDLPEPLNATALYAIVHAERVYLLVSARPADPRLLGAQQNHRGYRRPAVHGWLVAYARRSGTVLWTRKLDNVAFPLDQPRHVPLLLLSYVLADESLQTPRGVLRCLDASTGDLLYEFTSGSHVYFATTANRAEGWIDLKLRDRTVRFEYGPVPD